MIWVALDFLIHAFWCLQQRCSSWKINMLSQLIYVKSERSELGRNPRTLRDGWKRRVATTTTCASSCCMAQNSGWKLFHWLVSLSNFPSERSGERISHWGRFLFQHPACRSTTCGWWDSIDLWPTVSSRATPCKQKGGWGRNSTTWTRMECEFLKMVASVGMSDN